MVHANNVLNQRQLSASDTCCKQGNTIAMFGSSSVDKSTIVNGLMGFEAQLTSNIRDNDSKGRLTTNPRALKALPQGGLFLDPPGIRELQLGTCEQDVNETFSEITDLAQLCRFTDCSHDKEPGCTVRLAIESGVITSRRYASYQKLMREQALNGATLAEKRAKDKAFGKMINSVQSESRNRKKGAF
ncbi:GTPase RsgA [Shewanella sp. 3_MG-2023]|nr:GTPase RsgA [Shewanella sp. 3_MG-2023]MDO6776980.1 GTPase RsgA [Shewanella sp. 3_MG-2023]